MDKAVRDLTADELATLLQEHGSVRAVATRLNQPQTTVGDAYRRLKDGAPAPRPLRPRKGCLTREHLETALTPPNKCVVRALLDGMDDDEQTVLEEALGYSSRDFGAQQVIDMLVNAGYREQELPGSDAINNHRSGRRPCRCRG